MRWTIEVTAILPVFVSGPTSATFAAGAKPGRSADGLSCSYSLPANAIPTARCTAIKRQCGGKFAANYGGDRMLSGM
jgi:hypothetical protein